MATEEKTHPSLQSDSGETAGNWMIPRVKIRVCVFHNDNERDM